MEHKLHQAEVWAEKVVIPTYGIGKPNRNPMFLEKRVYQGSSGKVYPLPVIDEILDEKQDREWQAVFLENDYIRVMVLPELGGRIQRALDKTNNYDFVYYNEVIKPALVGLTGPWISGGIEFNWPQHHRPTTYSPVDWRIVSHEDGSASVELSEVDRMYGTKGKMTFTVYPDRAYIEIRGQLYNRTSLPQTFLWWANPAVAVNDDTQSVFPPDVCAVFDHGKRDVSSFPIATGIYYKHDYGAGVDISRYKNIPVPTSYMCAHSDYNFVGGYDYGVDAGILHVADHHISPGKKQWTWGNGDFGRAWDRNLTDENGPYIELMTGMFCDNQPDFTWLKPFEEKTFTQYFMPYKQARYVKNASREAAINLEIENGSATVTVYTTAEYKAARVLLTRNGSPILDRVADISPTAVFTATVSTDAVPTELELTLFAASGRRMLSYAPQEKKVERIPDPQSPARLPEELRTNEELYLTGLHLEQYRHATYLPDPYYTEALTRDPGDIRVNNAYGMLKLRRGQFAAAEANFRSAIQRMTERNPNPYDSEAYLNLGISLLMQERFDEAYDAFYKATWTAAQQEAGFYYLACIACRREEYDIALEHIERSLVRNWHSLKARALKGILLKQLGRETEAKTWLKENLALDAFDYVSGFESGDTEGTLRLIAGRTDSFIDCAIDYAEAGLYRRAADVLELCPEATPMLLYHKALYTGHFDAERAAILLKEASAADPTCCFPNRLEDISALQYAMQTDPEDARAPYYLGCLYYDRRRFEEAVALWEKSVILDPAYPTAWRNLALAMFNKRKDPTRALECLETAFRLDETDARVLLELDQLYRKLNHSIEDRFAFLTKHKETAFKRDDLYIEYCTLLNLQERYDEALTLLKSRHLHAWEGGEGKATTQYALALTQLARQSMKAGDAVRAKELLSEALVFPHNLGEGKLEGAKDNDIYYYLGLCELALGNKDASTEYLTRAGLGDEEPASAMYYNDQPAELILYEGLARRALGQEARATARFYKLISYGEKHYYDEVRIDYFAVSLPDLQLFESDLTTSNRAHCEYLIALGSYGLGDLERARRGFEAVLRIDAAHQGAIRHMRLLNEQ